MPFGASSGGSGRGGRGVAGTRAMAQRGRFGAQAGEGEKPAKGSRLATVALGLGACILAAVLGVGSAVGLYVMHSHGASTPVPAATAPASTAPAHATASPTGK